MANETNSPAQAAQSTDYVDDLFDYDVGLDGILQEINTNAPKQSAAPDNAGVVLGLDEEVKVTKQRKPVAKLDESRLLSQAGIPKLRRSSKKNLKFKGKGHEFSDLARLLNFYQLWLDDLFPRAKFADGLAMIEKLGHSKRLQTMRRTWIDEEKPRSVDDDISGPLQTGLNDNNNTNNDTSTTDNHHTSVSPTDQMDVDQSVTQPKQSDEMDDELFIPDSNNPWQTHDSGAPPNDDDFDELDALLRECGDESGPGKTESTGTKHDSIETNSEADELEAMEGLGMFREMPS